MWGPPCTRTTHVALSPNSATRSGPHSMDTGSGDGRLSGRSCMEALATWVKSNGGFVDPSLNIEDRQPSDAAKRYRGVFAGPDGLPANHTFLKLPYSGLVSADTSRISQRFDEWNCRYGLTSWDSLILALIYEETHRPSPWDAYLDFLPNQLETPLFWTDDERGMLKDTAAEVALGLDSIEAGFKDRLLPVMLDNRDLFDCSEPVLHRLYYRFGALVMAYSFTLGAPCTDQSDCDSDDEEQSASIAMVPVADALNHVSFATNAMLVHEDDDGYVSMQTLRAIAPGEELINTYGELGNDVLLVRYGFIDDGDNPYTNALVRYSDCTSTLGQKAFQRMTALGHKDYDLVNEYFFLRCPTDDEDLLEQIPDCLKSLLLCAIVSDDDLSRIMSSSEEINLQPFRDQMLKLLLEVFSRLPKQSADSTKLINFPKGSRLYIISRLKLEASNIMASWRKTLSQYV